MHRAVFLLSLALSKVLKFYFYNVKCERRCNDFDHVQEADLRVTSTQLLAAQSRGATVAASAARIYCSV